MRKIFTILAAGVLMTLGACSENDSPKPDPDNGDGTTAANTDYTEANAKSWGNYMSQVSGLLKSDAETLYAAWTEGVGGGKPFAETFKNHAGGDYSSALGCIEQIIDGCADIANEVGTAKIGEPYALWQSGDREKALYAVESWYSWHSREDYSNNILSIRNSYYGSLDGTENETSIAALMKGVNPDLDRRLRAGIVSTYDAILAIPQPFRNNIASSEASKAMQECAALEQLLSVELKAAVQKIEDARLQPIVEHYVDAVVLPTYRSLRDLNGELHAAVENFKAAPSDANFASACEAWLKARAPWETSEAFLFGPVDALGLDPNMDSWPLDQNAIVQILNSGDYDNLDWSDGDSDDRIEAVQSVRGFHTLEFLLFKEGAPRKVK